MELTILMPCLNEQETILICINRAFSFLEKNNIKGQVLIADNGIDYNDTIYQIEKLFKI